MPVRVHDIPEGDRPRERLLRRGGEALSDRELLAIVLRSGRPGESAIELAASLISEYGGLNGLASARPEELARRPGVGPAKAAAVVAAFRLGRLADRSSDPIVVLRSAEDIAAVAMQELAGARRENVIVLVCDAANRLRHVVHVAEGGIDRSLFPVREILNAVVRHDGKTFAIAHNHPSGDPKPSNSDCEATTKLIAAAKAVGLRFLEHIVVAGNSWRSTRPSNCVRF